MAWNEPGGNGKDRDPWSGGNNNRGGRGGDQGPPDLDEALKKVQDKLNNVFGGSGSGSSSSGSGKGGSSSFILVLVAVLLVGWAAMGFYTVDQQERGVVLRLGKFEEVVTPGLQWNPPLIDEVKLVNVTRVRSVDTRAQMLTEDENIVDVEMAVQYFVQNPENFWLRVRDPEKSLSQAAESALRHVVGTSEMHSILTEGREALAVQVTARLQAYMDEYGTGLQISKINIQNAQAPNQVQDAFDDVIKAREDEQRVKNQAESYANSIVPEARGRAQRILEEANAYREQVVARAQGDAKRFTALLNEYEKAPKVTRDRLYLDTLEKVMANNAKVLVDVEGGNNMMYLPLDKLMQNRPAASASSGPVRLDDQSLSDVTNQVIDEIRDRQRQNSRREGR